MPQARFSTGIPEFDRVLGGGVVPGAVDNLAASALAAALARRLANNPASVPPGVEIRFISFGGEEAGLRGSRRYVARLLALPSMKDWYTAALAETWRDEEHEAEVRAAGTWREDLRAR